MTNAGVTPWHLCGQQVAELRAPHSVVRMTELDIGERGVAMVTRDPASVSELVVGSRMEKVKVISPQNLSI